MNNSSPPLQILFFAARDLHRDYFSSLSHHLDCPSRVAWYKDIWLPGSRGLKFLSRANISHIVDLKIREKKNSPGNHKSGLYWYTYALVRRIAANVLFLKYFRYLEKYHSQYIVVWNGNKLRQAIVVQAAKCLNRQCAFFENGLLPNTTTLDFQGVNAFNSLPRHREFYDSLQFDGAGQLPSTLVARKPESDKKIIRGVTELPERFIFVPFQVNTDSQITIHSPWIRNMVHLFNEVSAAQTLIKDTSISFVFKEHPSDSQDYRSLHERVRQDDGLMFAHDFTTQELIERSAAVITINSTVGFEALLLGKKVIVLGDAFYGFEGLTMKVNNENELVEALNELQGWQPDARLRENFLRYIQSDYAIPDSWTSPGEKHWQRINEKFSCIKHENNHSLFMVSTPLNLLIASAVALENRESRKNDQKPVRCELCFIDQPGVSARSYVEAVKAWKESPFDVVHVFPSRASTPYKKLCNRRRAFMLARKIIDDLKPDMIAVGNDRRVEFQYAMFYSQSAGYVPRGAYLDDGTFTYVGRKTRGIQDAWIDNAAKKLFYGFWWQQPETVGSSAWVDDAYVAFPELVHKSLQQKSLHTINSGWFESPAIQSLSDALLKYFEVNTDRLRQLDVIITLPHASLVGDASGYADTMKQLVNELSNRGKKLGVKYHPRQAGDDPLGLIQVPGVELLPAVLAFETLLPGLGNPVIIGDVSTTLLSSRWLRPSLRVIAIAGGNQQQEFVELFTKLDIEMVSDVSMLAGKLQD
jgi:hypothetical protein